MTTKTTPTNKLTWLFVAPLSRPGKAWTVGAGVNVGAKVGAVQFRGVSAVLRVNRVRFTQSYTEGVKSGDGGVPGRNTGSAAVKWIAPFSQAIAYGIIPNFKLTLPLSVCVEPAKLASYKRKPPCFA